MLCFVLLFWFGLSCVCCLCDLLVWDEFVVCGCLRCYLCCLFVMRIAFSCCWVWFGFVCLFVGVLWFLFIEVLLRGFVVLVCRFGLFAWCLVCFIWSNCLVC